MESQSSPRYIKLQANHIQDQILINPSISQDNAQQKNEIQRVIPRASQKLTIIQDQQKTELATQVQLQKQQHHPKRLSQISQKLEALSQSQLSQNQHNIESHQNQLIKNSNSESEQVRILNPRQSDIIKMLPSKNISNQINRQCKIQEQPSFNYQKKVSQPVPLLKSKAKNIQQMKLQIQIKAQRSLIRVKEAINIPAMVSLKATGGIRTNIDVICVIDNSGSMKGQKIQLAKNAIKYVLDFLQENDRLCIITFNSKATKQCKLEFVNGENKQNFYKIIQNIYAQGGTNISSGLDLALQILRERTFVNEVTSLFLLSDGQNDKQYQSPKNKLQREICSPQNKIIGQFTLHSFGFGQGHDQNIMNGLSQLKDGTFYFIKQLSTIDEAFCNALGAVISVVAENIKIFFNVVLKDITKDIKVSKTYGKIKKLNDKIQEYSIKLGSIGSGMRKDYVFELNIPYIDIDVKDFQRNHQLIKASFSGKKPNGQIIMGGCSLNITLVNQHQNIPDSIQNIDVIENYLRVKTVEEIQNSLKLADKQKYKEAQKILDGMVSQIQSSKKAREIKKKQLIKDLKLIKQKCQKKVWATEGRKMGTYLISGHSDQTTYDYPSDFQGKFSQKLTSMKYKSSNP